MSAAESPDQQQDGVSAPSSDEDNNKEDGRGVAPKSLQEDFLKNKNVIKCSSALFDLQFLVGTSIPRECNVSTAEN